MANEVRWLILGCARIARRAIIRAIQAAPSAELVAIASRDREKAAAWAKEFGIPRFFGSYEEAVAHEGIEAVYIPLPNELHRPWTIRAAEGGKHVLCDKPLALNAGEAEEMVQACRSHGVLLQEGFMWRHHPRALRALELVRSGVIGELRLVRASFSFDINRTDWRLDPARGGGALWDIGCYGVNAARFFTGAEPDQVQAEAVWWETGVDMTLVAQLGFGSRTLAQIDCSFEVPFRCHMEIVGTRGTLELPDAFLPRTPAPLVINESGAVRTESFQADQYAEMIEAFSRAVRARQPLAWPAEDGLLNMRALDRVLAAAKQTG